MESAGAVQMFTRSIAKNNLIYDKYLGDGDSSSFKDVVDSNPYSEHGIIPKKDECVGHVQKRVGTRLRKIAKDYRKEEPVVDKKGNPVMKDGKQVKKIIKISGKGKLTDTVINSMQNFYGLPSGWLISDTSGQFRQRIHGVLQVFRSPHLGPKTPIWSSPPNYPFSGIPPI